MAGALTNSGSLSLDSYYHTSGSTLSIGGTLTNTGMLAIGNTSLASPSKVSATALTNLELDQSEQHLMAPTRRFST